MIRTPIMLIARHALPEVTALSAAEKFKPSAVALPIGDAVIGVFGANATPMSVVRWSAGADPVVREYPEVDYDSDEVNAREKKGDFDAFSDFVGRNPAGRPIQLVAIGGRPWLVRAYGHARIDVETLDVVPAARSRVKWIVSLPKGDILAGSGAEYSAVDAFQRFQRCPADMIDQPIFRTRTGLTGNSDWVLQGTSFPAGDAATAFTDGIAKVRGKSAGSFHALAVAVLGQELIVYGRELARSGSSRPALVAIDIDKAEVTRHVPVKEDDPFVPAATGGALLGLGAKAIYRIAPDSLTITDQAPLPSGLRLIGHDATRIVAMHKRNKAVLVLASEAFSGPLAAAVEQLSAALAKPKAGAKSKK